MIADVRGAVAKELGELAQARQAVFDAREAMHAALLAAKAAGATHQEIGDVLGVTRQRVSQMLAVHTGEHPYSRYKD